MSASDVKKAAAILSDPTMTKAEVAEHFKVNKTTLNTSMKREGYSI
jgi:predicted transcriptional regulator